MLVDELFYIGYTSKTFGKSGELIINLDVGSPDLFFKEKVFFVVINDGDVMPVPVFVEGKIKGHQGNLRIQFDHIDSIEDAQKWVGKKVMLPLDLLEKNPEIIQDDLGHIIGFTVEDTNIGVVGKVREVVSNSMQDLLCIDSEEGEEYMMPIVEEFIIAVKVEQKIIVVSTPEGLFDLDK